jgi:hypothetical protein
MGHAVAGSYPAQHIHGVGLEQPGAHPPLHVIAIAALDHHRLDTSLSQQEGQRQAGWTRPDGSDLGAQSYATRRSLGPRDSWRTTTTMKVKTVTPDKVSTSSTRV